MVLKGGDEVPGVSSTESPRMRGRSERWNETEVGTKTECTRGGRTRPIERS